MDPRRLIVPALILSALLMAGPAGHADDGRLVLAAGMDGAINPVSAEYLDKSLQEASERKAEALVIMLDTPGGLDSSMREMVKAILGSPVPVITYISPAGARAASAGVFITLASPLAAMAPGTNIGAAHPVGIGGGQLGKDMSAKVENDAAAYIKSLAEKYGRNASWAEEAVRKSVSLSEKEALKMRVVDLLADDLDDLLKKADGVKVTTSLGGRTLHTRGARVERMEPGGRLKLLKVIGDPNVAYILMMIGIIGLFFELSNPGLVLPGVVGGISLILAFYAFQTLPVNYAGLLLILLAVVLFVAEVKVMSHGLLSLAGVVSFILGSIMLMDSRFPYMRVSLKVILPSAATLTAFFVILIKVALKARRARVTTGAEGLVGETGEARTDVGAQGSVFVQGALWGAYSDVPLKKGEKVTVLRVEGLKLKVGKRQP